MVALRYLASLRILTRVSAISSRKTEQRLLSYVTKEEMKAILTWVNAMDDYDS